MKIYSLFILSILFLIGVSPSAIAEENTDGQKDMLENFDQKKWPEFLPNLNYKDRTYNVLLLGTDKEDSVIQSFNKSLTPNSVNGKILKCRRLVDLPVGTARGNHSYGGVCMHQVNGIKKVVLICNDEMVGHFQMKTTQSYSSDILDLTQFVADNCYGG